MDRTPSPSKDPAPPDQAPSVSVLIPTYNTGAYLEGTIRSILDQDLTDLELIVLDDGSTDGSAQVARRLAEQDPRLLVHTQENLGIAATRNRLLELARSDLVAWLDHDDLALPSRLRTQVDYMREHPECVALGTRIELIDDEDLPIHCPRLVMTHEEIEARHFAGELQLAQTASIMRKRAVVDCGGYRDRFNLAEDYDLCLRLGELGELANLDMVLTRHRQLHSSAGHSNMPRQRRAAIEAIREARLRRKMPDATNLADVESPVQAPLSRSEQHRIWGWWALQAGNVATARRHARRSIAASPLRVGPWVLLACALRGH